MHIRCMQSTVICFSTPNTLTTSTATKWPTWSAHLHISVEKRRNSNSGENAHHWGEHQHETDHHTSKVDAGDTVQHDKDVGIVELREAEVQSDREHEHQELQVKVERRPRGWLMLTNGGNDGDVVLGVRGIQEGVEAASPRGNLACEGEDATSNSNGANEKTNKGFEEELKLFWCEL